MEPPSKRPRLSFGRAHPSSDFARASPRDDLHHHRDKHDPLLRELDEPEDPEADELNEPPELVNARRDPAARLERSRALAALRLKSAFERIFAKYERDFSGAADEIDLRTGEIVVDNGHVRSLAQADARVLGGDGGEDGDADDGDEGQGGMDAETADLNDEERIMRGRRVDSEDSVAGFGGRLSLLGTERSASALGPVPVPVWEPPFFLGQGGGGWPGPPAMWAGGPVPNGMPYPGWMPFGGVPMQFGPRIPKAASDPTWRAPELPAAFAGNRPPSTATAAKKIARLSLSTAREQDDGDGDDLLLDPSVTGAQQGEVEGAVTKRKILLPRPFDQGVSAKKKRGRPPKHLKARGAATKPGKYQEPVDIQGAKQDDDRSAEPDDTPGPTPHIPDSAPRPQRHATRGTTEATQRDTGPAVPRIPETSKEDVEGPGESAGTTEESHSGGSESQIAAGEAEDPDLYLDLSSAETRFTRKPRNQVLRVEILARKPQDARLSTIITPDDSCADSPPAHWEAPPDSSLKEVLDAFEARAVHQRPENSDREEAVQSGRASDGNASRNVVERAPAKQPVRTKTAPAEVFARNVVDAAYAFSDEDEPALPKSRGMRRMSTTIKMVQAGTSARDFTTRGVDSTLRRSSDTQQNHSFGSIKPGARSAQVLSTNVEHPAHTHTLDGGKPAILMSGGTWRKPTEASEQTSVQDPVLREICHNVGSTTPSRGPEEHSDSLKEIDDSDLARGQPSSSVLDQGPDCRGIDQPERLEALEDVSRWPSSMANDLDQMDREAVLRSDEPVKRRTRRKPMFGAENAPRVEPGTAGRRGVLVATSSPKPPTTETREQRGPRGRRVGLPMGTRQQSGTRVVKQARRQEIPETSPYASARADSPSASKTRGSIAERQDAPPSTESDRARNEPTQTESPDTAPSPTLTDPSSRPGKISARSLPSSSLRSLQPPQPPSTPLKARKRSHPKPQQTTKAPQTSTPTGPKRKGVLSLLLDDNDEDEEDVLSILTPVRPTPGSGSQSARIRSTPAAHHVRLGLFRGRLGTTPASASASPLASPRSGRKEGDGGGSGSGSRNRSKRKSRAGAVVLAHPRSTVKDDDTPLPTTPASTAGIAAGTPSKGPRRAAELRGGGIGGVGGVGGGVPSGSAGDGAAGPPPPPPPPQGTPSHGPRRMATDLVQTPGGTMRRCGEGGFRCERDFCFVCLRG